jgi:hypothetical protein
VNHIERDDVYRYFEVYEAYQKAEDPEVLDQLDRKLSEYKDRFHKDSEEILKILIKEEKDFLHRHEVPYRDLIFDLEMHAKSLEEIKKTHTFDTEQNMWVPRKRKEKGPA